MVAEFSRHMRRAITAARALKIAMPNEEIIRKEVSTVLATEPYEVGRLRICIGVSGLTVTHDSYQDAIENAFITFSPHTSKVKGEQYKTFPYDSHYEVVDEAKLHGFDDAIIFNSSNNVTETALSNLLFRIDGKWITPPITAGILPGVMRAISIERSDVEVRNVHITEVPTATDVLLLNSLKIAQPVEQIGEMRLECGEASRAMVAQIRGKLEFFSVG